MSETYEKLRKAVYAKMHTYQYVTYSFYEMRLKDIILAIGLDVKVCGSGGVYFKDSLICTMDLTKTIKEQDEFVLEKLLELVSKKTTHNE